MTLEALRTPEERFAHLPNFAYPPQYVDDLPGYEGLRAAYVDVGPRSARYTCLCLHGEPSWSFLYRRMIPVFVERGCRVIAPDFYGFGRSDKPVNDSDYRFHWARSRQYADCRVRRAAVKFWSEQWNGAAFMAIGAADPVLGVEVMRKLHAMIRGCGAPLVIADGGHFLQEWGREIAVQAMDYFQQ